MNEWGRQLRGHGRIVCTCGRVLAQCRCIKKEGHTTTVVKNGCPECQRKAAEIAPPVAAFPTRPEQV